MSPAAAAAARRERGWNAPLTDVYFCVQLGRDWQPPTQGPRDPVVPRGPLVDHKTEGVSGSRPPKGWGVVSGCSCFHPLSRSIQEGPRRQKRARPVGQGPPPPLARP